MQQLAYLNKYLFKYRWHFLAGIVFVSLANWFSVLQPRIIREALDLVIQNVSTTQSLKGFDARGALFQNLSTTLLYFGLLVLALALLQGMFMYFMRQTIIVMSRLIEYDLRKELFAHYERLDLSFYRRNNTGDLMARITEDVNKVRTYLGPAILYGINLITLFVLVIGAMLRVSPTLTMYSLLPLPILAVSIYYVSSIINRKSTVIQQQLASLNSMAQEIYSGIRVVKSYVQELPMVKTFAVESEVYKERSLSLARVDAFFYPLMVLLIGLSTIITVYIGGRQVATGLITTGNVAEFVIYVNMLTWPVTSIGWIASIIQQAAASQKRINEFLQQEPAVMDPQSPIVSLAGKIEFDQVSFTYPDTGIRALRDISFTLEAGQKLAIVGRTGSGKTTIADLLVRMYDVTAGRILIDGTDIRQHNLAHLRQRIGYVPQDVFLFSDTISNNVRFGRASATQEDVADYARRAAIYNEIMELPEGFETLSGERGVTLSGGQKQRISIARAFVKQPDIILMDDSLSAVDTHTEKQILGYLDNELAHKTAIIITHRIYSLLTFDLIIVLDEGRIIERGTHDELVADGGYYADMFEQQQLQEVAE